MEEITQEEVQRSVMACYDSVNLINTLVVKESKTKEDEDCISRNKEHIGIMLGKDWFVAGLTAEQKAELELLKK
jgi:hypothetical protein